MVTVLSVTITLDSDLLMCSDSCHVKRGQEEVQQVSFISSGYLHHDIKRKVRRGEVSA